MKPQGVIPALVTAFDEQDRFDPQAQGRLMSYLRNAGVSGWVPCGSTGEYYAMSADERAAVLEFVKDFAKPGEQLIAGTNAGSTREVIEHTRRARDIGYDTVLLSAPYYAMPDSAELVKHYETVAAECDVDIVIYNYPYKLGIEIDFDALNALAENPRIVAIKDSSGVLQRAVDIHGRYDGRIDLCSGSDDIALDFFIWGAKSWICGPANCMAHACVDMVNTYLGGDLDGARSKMLGLYWTMKSLESGKFVQKVKYGCELVGVPVGNARGPLQPLDETEKRAFKTALEPLLAGETRQLDAA